jgi:hypothetical protein
MVSMSYDSVKMDQARRQERMRKAQLNGTAFEPRKRREWRWRWAWNRQQRPATNTSGEAVRAH